MKNLFIILLLLLDGCNNAQTQRETKQFYAEYPWQFTTPMPHGRYGHDAVFAANGKIYVMGGLVYTVTQGFKKAKGLDGWMIGHFNNGRYSNLAYDTNKNQWEYMTAIPNRLFLDKFILYDPNNDSWKYVLGSVNKLTQNDLDKLTKQVGGKPLKIYETNLERQGNGVAVANFSNGFICWLGGQSFAGEVENTVLPYNFKQDTWPEPIKNEMDGGSWVQTLYNTIIPPMQEPRRDHRAVGTSDGKIYVLGGWHEEMILNKTGNNFGTGKNIILKTMECYDPKTNKWEYKKPLSCERMSFAAVAGKDGKIYVFGGAAGVETDPKTPILNTVEVYDPENDSWSFRKPMPVKRSGHSAVLAADGKIYILGGTEVPDAPLNTVFIYDPERDAWEKGPDMILPRDVLAAVATPDGKIYAIGGTDVGAYENKAIWKHLVALIPKDELGDYAGKVQDTVEVLDIYKWRKSKKKK
jgi:N-acetylneuraminic acid mutarotase